MTASASPRGPWVLALACGWATTALAIVSATAQTNPTPQPTPTATASPAPSPTPATTPTPSMTPTPTATPTPSATPTPTPSATATPTATPTPTPTASPSATPTPDASATPATPKSDSATTGQIVELTSHPAAYFEGKASRDEVYGAITGALANLRAEIGKAGLKPVGHPITVFLEADDEGFRYRTEIPLEAAPEGKTQLSATVKIGQSPAGRAMKFEHRGAYDDIDSTYEAITAFLDEKGVDAQDVFIEEYLNETKTSDDPNLQIDIYVLVK